jgi:hypothetical protein
MTKTLHGRVRGKTIELDEDLGVADGQEVEIQVTIVPPQSPIEPPVSEGLGRFMRFSEDATTPDAPTLRNGTMSISHEWRVLTRPLAQTSMRPDRAAAREIGWVLFLFRVGGAVQQREAVSYSGHGLLQRRREVGRFPPVRSRPEQRLDC